MTNKRTSTDWEIYHKHIHNNSVNAYAYPIPAWAPEGNRGSRIQIFWAATHSLCCVVNKDNVILVSEYKATCVWDAPNIFRFLKVFINSTHRTVGWTMNVIIFFRFYSSTNIDVKNKVSIWRWNFMATCRNPIKNLINIMK